MVEVKGDRLETADTRIDHQCKDGSRKVAERDHRGQRASSSWVKPACGLQHLGEEREDAHGRRHV